MDVLQSLPLAVTVVLGLLAAAWLVLWLLVPFMIESIRGSTRKARLELEAINQKLDLLTTLLAERNGTSPEIRHGTEHRREPRLDLPGGAASNRTVAERARREPTLTG
jgi:hypothetical protein